MKAFYNIALLFLFFTIALAMAPDPSPATSPPMKTENPHLQQYELVNVTPSNQQLLTLTGQRFDLAKITDAQAEVLYRSGCQYIKPVTCSPVPSENESTGNNDIQQLADSNTPDFDGIKNDNLISDMKPPNISKNKLRKADK